MFLWPNADDVDGNWLNESGNNTNLYASLDETSASDTDYIVSPNNPVDEVCKIALSDPVGTPAEPFILRYRFNNIGGTALRVRLMQGATPIAVWNESGSGWTTSEKTLASGEFASITDFNNLFVEFKASSGDLTLALDLDFTSGTLDSKVTFARSSTATYYNSSGLVATAASGAPRFDYDPVALTPRGLLMEEQRTNLVLQSGNLGNTTNWLTFINGSGSISQTANSAVAPDGTTTAALIAINRSSTSDYAQLYQGGINAPAIGTGSVWLKAATGGDVGKQITLACHTGSTYEIVFAITLTANWVRYAATSGISLSTANQFILGYYAGSVGTGAVNFLAWGAQLEAGAFATSYISTTSAAVTRSADMASMTGTNFSSWCNASEGSFVVDLNLAAAGACHILNVNGAGWSGDRMVLYVGPPFQDYIAAGGAGYKNDTLGTATAGAHKLALAYKLNDAGSCLDGGTVLVDTSVTVPTIDRLHLGRDEGTGANATAWFKRLRFYNVRKTNAELQALTT